jgi:hypothetical protein
MSVFSTPVQEKASNAWTSGTALNITGMAAATNGNSLILRYSGSLAGGNAVIASIANYGGVAWIRARSHGTGRAAEIWYCPNVSGGGTSIAITMAGTPSAASAQSATVSEWPGVITADSVNSANGTSTTAAPGNATPTTGRDALVIVATRVGGTYSAGPDGGFTALLSGDASFRDFGGYLVVDPTTGASYNPTYTAASGTWGSAIATFLAPAGVKLRPYMMGA